MSYHDLWSILANWKPEFTVKEFTSVFASPDPNKVLHDMSKKGFIENTGWGKYKVNSPKEYINRKTNVVKAYELVKEAERKHAFTDADAVFFWTRGGYQVDRFFGFYPIHIAVNRHELGAWKKFFHSRKQRFVVEKEPMHETMFGLFYVLYPRDRFRAEEVEGSTVMPLKETVEFCKKNIFTYQPALEMLDEMYGLKLKVKYREEKTNF
jgi:hypothetical protein